jgi:carbonic anhydrase
MLNDLLARNVAWSKQRHAEEPDYFTRLATWSCPVLVPVSFEQCLL